MTDGPPILDADGYLYLHGVPLVFIQRSDGPVTDQLAAAARVPELEAEIERLRGRYQSWVLHSASQEREIRALRASLAAAPDLEERLTELRAAMVMAVESGNVAQVLNEVSRLTGYPPTGATA